MSGGTLLRESQTIAEKRNAQKSACNRIFFLVSKSEDSINGIDRRKKKRTNLSLEGYEPSSENSILRSDISF